MRVCVIGAGVVGVTSAYFLARQGHDVVLVDSQPRPAEVSSYANGGQLSYSYVAPLAGPGAAERARLAAALGLAAALPAQAGSASMALVPAVRAGLPRLGGARLDRRAADPVLPEPRRHARAAGPGEPGFRPSEERQAHRLPQRRVAGQGARAGRLPGRAWRRPAGAGRRPDPGAGTGPGRHGRQPGGAIYTPSEEAGDCRQFTEALFDRLQGMANVQCAMSNPVSGLQREGRRVVAVQSRDGDIGADAVVLATGIGTRALLAAGPRRAALSAQGLQPDRAAGRRRPHGARHQRHRLRTPHRVRPRGVLRIAAMVDIGGGDAQIDPERIALLKRQVHEAFPGLDLRQAIPWPDCGRPRPRASR